MSRKRKATALEDLLAAPVISIGEAQSALQRSNIRSVMQFLERKDDGAYAARTLNLCLRRQQGGEVHLSVPLISLVSLPHMLIDDASVSMNAAIQYSSSRKAAAPFPDSSLSNENTHVPRLHCKLMPATPRRGRQSAPGLKLSMKVRSNPPNEGIQRIQDRLMATEQGGSKNGKSS